ncbi:uncharacterized protein LOC134294628 isoform X2 [Anolis carolinensis]|uniref:uncharacterized protein LOC134294628 isoform X2 n=1 Tax=Anolis carolinensis TaxID=28377 RepID=UPI002F2B74DE
MVVLGDTCSDLWPLACGVPQGSIPSPMLLDIHMNPLGELIQSFGIWCHLWACFHGSIGVFISLIKKEEQKVKHEPANFLYFQDDPLFHSVLVLKIELPRNGDMKGLKDTQKQAKATRDPRSVSCASQIGPLLPPHFLHLSKEPQIPKDVAFLPGKFNTPFRHAEMSTELVSPGLSPRWAVHSLG